MSSHSSTDLMHQMKSNKARVKTLCCTRTSEHRIKRLLGYQLKVTVKQFIRYKLSVYKNPIVWFAWKFLHSRFGFLPTIYSAIQFVIIFARHFVNSWPPIDMTFFYTLSVKRKKICGVFKMIRKGVTVHCWEVEMERSYTQKVHIC